MKKLLLFIIVPAIAVSCTNTPDIGAPHAASQMPDTAGLAEFHSWKAKQSITAKPNTVYVVREAPQRVSHPSPQPVYTPTSSPEVVNDVPGASQPEQQQKKGWSKAAKGAAIGAGSGAVLGAVIHKRNRVVGGVVGGAVGAGVGYGIGRHIDKKEGRY
jgi:hypothetical protein